MDSNLPQMPTLATLGTLGYPPGTIGDAALGASSVSAYMQSASVLAESVNKTFSYVESLNKACSNILAPYVSPNGAVASAYKPLPLMTPVNLYAAPHSITPYDRAAQAHRRTVRDLQEKNEIAEYRQQIAELKAQLGQRDYRIAELEVQDADWHALTEALRRKLYELQLLAPTCEACHIAFNKRKEDGTLEIKAQKNATVCNHKLGDPDCARRQKAQSVAESRAEKKRADRVASNEYESTGD